MEQNWIILLVIILILAVVGLVIYIFARKCKDDEFDQEDKTLQKYLNGRWLMCGFNTLTLGSYAANIVYDKKEKLFKDTGGEFTIKIHRKQKNMEGVPGGVYVGTFYWSKASKKVAQVSMLFGNYLISVSSDVGVTVYFTRMDNVKRYDIDKDTGDITIQCVDGKTETIKGSVFGTDKGQIGFSPFYTSQMNDKCKSS